MKWSQEMNISDCDYKIWLGNYRKGAGGERERESGSVAGGAWVGEGWGVEEDDAILSGVSRVREGVSGGGVLISTLSVLIRPACFLYKNGYYQSTKIIMKRIINKWCFPIFEALIPRVGCRRGWLNLNIREQAGVRRKKKWGWVSLKKFLIPSSNEKLRVTKRGRKKNDGDKGTLEKGFKNKKEIHLNPPH